MTDKLVVPKGFMKWLEAVMSVSALSGLDDDEIIPTWPDSIYKINEDIPELSIGDLRQIYSIVEPENSNDWN